MIELARAADRCAAREAYEGWAAAWVRDRIRVRVRVAREAYEPKPRRVRVGVRVRVIARG